MAPPSGCVSSRSQSRHQKDAALRWRFQGGGGNGEGNISTKKTRQHGESTAQINRRPIAHERAQSSAQRGLRAKKPTYVLRACIPHCLQKNGTIKTISPGLLCRRSADGRSPSRIHRPPPPRCRSAKTTKNLGTIDTDLREPWGLRGLVVGR